MHIDAPCKEIQDSLGFWMPRSGFPIPGIGIVNGSPDSLSCILYSGIRIFLDEANIAKPVNTLYYGTVTRHRLWEYHDRSVVCCPSLKTKLREIPCRPNFVQNKRRAACKVVTWCSNTFSEKCSLPFPSSFQNHTAKRKVYAPHAQRELGRLEVVSFPPRIKLWWVTPVSFTAWASATKADPAVT